MSLSGIPFQVAGAEAHADKTITNKSELIFFISSSLQIFQNKSVSASIEDSR